MFNPLTEETKIILMLTAELYGTMPKPLTSEEYFSFRESRVQPLKEIYHTGEYKELMARGFAMALFVVDLHQKGIWIIPHTEYPEDLRGLRIPFLCGHGNLAARPFSVEMLGTFNNLRNTNLILLPQNEDEYDKILSRL
jgi:hypothetical protein